MATIFFSESSNNIGGQELQLLQQAEVLKARGHHSHILCRPGSRIAQEAKQRGLTVHPVRFRNALDFKSIGQVMGLLRKHRPAAMVCHSGHDSNGCALAVHLLAGLGLLKPRPLLLRMRTYIAGSAKPFTYNRLFDHTYTPSEALRQQLLNNTGIWPHKVSVLYPGIDFEGIAAAARQPLPGVLMPLIGGAAVRRPVIAHAAMLRGEKGHLFMLQVVQALVPSFPNLLYVIAGEGALREAIEADIQRLGLMSHVVLVGMLNPVAPLIAHADVLVMPSTYEPLGMSQIEALSLGVPVVVSNVGGLPETVLHGQTGSICPSPEEDGALQVWVQVLREVLSHPIGALKMAECGRDWVRKRFAKEENIKFLPF
jgi:glycosyltransferase involved in cell wall biosynthesis